MFSRPLFKYLFMWYPDALPYSGDTMVKPDKMTAKIPAYGILCSSVLLGAGSLTIFALFLFLGPFDLLDFGLSEPVSLGLNTSLCLIFFIQHSGMTRKSFRRWLERFIPPDFHNAFYTMMSGILIFTLIFFWQSSSHDLIKASGGLRWILRIAFFLGCTGMTWGAMSLRFYEPFGILKILRSLRGPGLPKRVMPFVIRGPYRWVRHPLYGCSLVLIWSCPDLSLDRLLFNALFTGWIIIGILLEERDLTEALGNRYRTYQNHVPMIIPYRGKKD